jgi:hypothetical protein
MMVKDLSTPLRPKASSSALTPSGAIHVGDEGRPLYEAIARGTKAGSLNHLKGIKVMMPRREAANGAHALQVGGQEGWIEPHGVGLTGIATRS